MKLPITGYSVLVVPTTLLRTDSLQAQNTGLSGVSDWEWLLIVFITIIVVWILIVIQVRSQPTQDVGSELVSENLH